MSRHSHQHRTAVIRVSGVSLVELLISMTLGLILIAGMIAVFSGNKRTAELNTAMANIQENARFALSAIARDIRMSSYQGCLDSRRGALVNRAVNVPIPTGIGMVEGVQKYVFNDSSATGAVVDKPHEWIPEIAGGFVPPVDNPAIPGTHAIVLQYASKRFSRLSQEMQVGGFPSPAGTIFTDANLGFAVGDLAVISNCDNSDLFAVSNVGMAGDGQFLEHKSPLNWNGNLTFAYGGPKTNAMTEISRFVSNIYYIGDTGLTNETGDEVRALYQQSYPYNDINNPPSELVQGVENMRISYGLRSQNTLRYVSADDPDFQPSQVESIRIGIIMASYDRISEQEDQNTYVIAGHSIGPATSPVDATEHAADQRYRLVFNTTVKVRNRRGDRIFMSQQ